MPEGIKFHGEGVCEFQYIHQVCSHEHQQGLGFGIAKASVVLQDHGAALGEHDVRVEYAGEGYVACLESLECGGNDTPEYFLFGGFFNERQGGEYSHAACIEALVSIERAFVVLVQRKVQALRSLADDGRADFVTLQVVFDHSNIAPLTKNHPNH